MPKIEAFKFGCIIIDGNKHRRDVLLFPDGTVCERKRGFWRFGSHSIKKEEVEELIEAGPDIFVFGKGVYSRAKLSSDAARYLKESKTELIILPSRKAVQKWNELSEKGKRAAALIHITC